MCSRLRLTATPPLRPASRASLESNSCAVPFACAAFPPLLAISFCFSRSIDANPRLLRVRAAVPPEGLRPLSCDTSRWPTLPTELRASLPVLFGILLPPGDLALSDRWPHTHTPRAGLKQCPPQAHQAEGFDCKWQAGRARWRGEAWSHIAFRDKGLARNGGRKSESNGQTI